MIGYKWEMRLQFLETKESYCVFSSSSWSVSFAYGKYECYASAVFRSFFLLSLRFPFLYHNLRVFYAVSYFLSKYCLLCLFCSFLLAYLAPFISISCSFLSVYLAPFYRHIFVYVTSLPFFSINIFLPVFRFFSIIVRERIWIGMLSNELAHWWWRGFPRCLRPIYQQGSQLLCHIYFRIYQIKIEILRKPIVPSLSPSLYLARSLSIFLFLPLSLSLFPYDTHSLPLPYLTLTLPPL